MKKGIIFTSFSIAFISIILLVQFKNESLKNNSFIHINEGTAQTVAEKNYHSPRYHEDIQYNVNMASHERESITFIMNDEMNNDEEYYKAAEKHFKMNPTTEFETLVNHCGSILSIIEHLENTPTANGEPWGKINIIQYNPDWKGIHILTEEERSVSEEIVEAMDLNMFNPLDDHIIDAETEIMIDGTGIGNNEGLMKLIALAFGGNDDARPIVRSSKFISTYESTEHESRKYMTESFFGFFPSSDAVVTEILITQLQNNYPEEEMDWWKTLDRLEPRFPGDSYTNYDYEDDLTTVCILRAMTVENNEAPFTPLPFEADINDERFYTTITASPKNNDVLSFNE